MLITKHDFHTGGALLASDEPPFHIYNVSFFLTVPKLV